MKEIFRPNYNLKVYRSTSQNKIVPQHDQIVERIEEQLTQTFGDEYKDLRFFISGSYMLNQLFYMDKKSNDIDIYPRDEDSKNKLIELILKHNTGNIFESDIAFSVDIKDTKYQVVKNVYPEAIDLFATFDIDLCCFAYSRDAIHINKESLNSISLSRLNLNKTELIEDLSDESLLTARMSTLFSRIKKYTERYDLLLSDQTYDVIKMLTEKIPMHCFTPSTGIVVTMMNSDGQLETKSIKTSLWADIYDYLTVSVNKHQTYFVEYLDKAYKKNTEQQEKQSEPFDEEILF
jgi:hypothetical protein